MNHNLVLFHVIILITFSKQPPKWNPRYGNDYAQKITKTQHKVMNLSPFCARYFKCLLNTSHLLQHFRPT